MGEIWYFPFEEQFIIWLQSLGEGTFLQPLLIWLNSLFSMFGEALFCVLLMGMVYWGFDKKKGEVIGLSLIMANVFAPMIKNVFRRLRPFVVSDRIVCLREVSNYSFPSGHSASCASAYPAASYEYPKEKWLKRIAVIVPLLCAFSRNYLGAHWLSDVIVGLALGALSFVLVAWIMHRHDDHLIIYLVFIGFSLIGLLYCHTDDYFTFLGILIGFVAGRIFEERHVHFENTDKLYLALIRTGGAALVYLGGSGLLKKVFELMTQPQSMQGFLLRSVRYAVMIFVVIGVYPLAFRYEKKMIDYFRRIRKDETSE